MASPVLFLSGAGLPPWIWNGVRLGLSVRSVVAPRPGVPDEATVTDRARTALEAAPRGQVTVVAHSSGGLVAAEIARLDPSRVSAVLAVCAVVPSTGGSLVDSLPLPDSDASIRSRLAAGVDERTAEQLVADFHPEPRSYFTSVVSSTAELMAVPRTAYLTTTEDTELTVARQHRFADLLGTSERPEVPAGHLPMLTHPAAVIDAIVALG